MLGVEADLDGMDLNYHFRIHSRGQRFLSANDAEDALAVGELFDRLRCATRIYRA
jgi:hypothetical protein